MANREYYLSDEYRSTPEFKPFKAEIYKKAEEFKKNGPEVADTGPETKFGQEQPQETNRKKAGETEENKRQRFKRLFDRVSESAVKIVGTTAGTVVAAAAVAIVYTDVLQTPSKQEFVAPTLTSPVQEIVIETGANYLFYNMHIMESADGVEYKLIVSDGKTEREDTIRAGLNERLLTGLTPQSVYTLSIREVFNGEDLGVCYQTTARTDAAGGDYIDETYGATLYKASADDVTVEWGTETNVLTLPIAFDGGESNYGYRVQLQSETGEIIDEYCGRESSVSFEIPVHVDEVSLVYEELYIGDWFEYSYGTTILDERIVFTLPTIEFLPEKTLHSQNYYQIPYRITTPNPQREKYLELYIQCDLWEDEYVVKNFWINETSYLGVECANDTESFVLSATMVLEGAYGGNLRTVTAEDCEYVNELEFNANTYMEYRENEKYVVMDFAYRAPVGAYVLLTNHNTGEEIIVDGTYYEEAVREDCEYSYVLMSADNAALTATENVQFRADVNPTYEANYLNPLDILVTYNDNGTINLYVDMNFVSDDSNVFYEIHYRASGMGFPMVYRSTEEVARIENLPFKSYYLQYYIICEIDGVRYQLNCVIPSGGVEDFSDSYISLTGNDTTVEVLIDRNCMFGNDLELCVNGEQTFTFTKEDMIYQNTQYSFQVESSTLVETATLRVQIVGKEQDYESLKERLGAENVKGKIYYTKEIQWIGENI